jgi:hypothetical protein
MTGTRVFAFAGLALAVIGAVGTLVVRIVAPAPLITVAFGFGVTVMIGFLIEGLIWASIGALLVVRRPDNAVGWLMVLVGVGHVLSQLSVSLASAFAAEGTAQGERLAQYAGWATVLLQLFGVFQIAIGFLFPTGRVQNRGWAWFMRLFWAFAIVFVVISLIQPGPLQLIPALQNPFAFGPDLRGGRPMAPILSVLTVIIFLGLGISMVSRYRLAGRVERLQLQWFVLALGLSAIGLGVVMSAAIFMDRPVDATGLTVYVFAGALVPVAIGVAILRYHLYDLDRLISRSIGYAVVTATLAGVFAGTALILGTVLGSQGAGETFQVAGATLLVLALFGPLRRRAQTVVDRRFDRARYDAERTALAFAERLRSEVDLDSVTMDLARTAGTTVSPSSLRVWIRARGAGR